MWLKKIICKLGIHKPKYMNRNFRDIVSGDMVFHYKCEWCKKKWMANSKYNTFKVYNK